MRIFSFLEPPGAFGMLLESLERLGGS